SGNQDNVVSEYYTPGERAMSSTPPSIVITQPADDTPAPGDIVETLMRLLHTIRRRHHARFSSQELSGPRMRLLSALAEQQPVRMGDLAARLGLSARTITALVDALEQEGLLARRPDPTDRRAILIELTASGGAYTAQVSGGL